MKSCGFNVPLNIALILCLSFTGCTTPEQKGQDLYNQGKYDELVTQYPDLPVADRAREKLAEKWFLAGQYTQVLASYPDSPFAARAQDSLAMELFRQGNFKDILLRYPESPVVNLAREKLAEQLLMAAAQASDPSQRQALLEKIIQDYPNTSAASQARQMLNELPPSTASTQIHQKPNSPKPAVKKSSK